MGQVTLRPARADDLAAVNAVYAAARPLEVGDDPEREIRFLRLPTGSTTLATVDGQAVGFITIAGEEIRFLYVHPHRHGRGIGRALLQTALAEIGGVAKLSVYKRNRRALTIYERAGFVLETSIGEMLILRREAARL
jgi:putative acetyltransferase